MTEDDFVGAKIAFFAPDGGILCYLRDDRADLPYPGCWDLPGGGREGGETPVECALREMEEEFGLRMAPDRLEWSGRFAALLWPDRHGWMFGGRIHWAELQAIRFGTEGQRWTVMRWDDFGRGPQGIDALRERAMRARAGLGLGD